MPWITGWASVHRVALRPAPAACNGVFTLWPSTFRTAEMLDPSTVVKKATGQVSCMLNDEVAVLNVDRALYFGMKDVAAHIWETLQEPRSFAEICDGVVAQFDV